MSDHLLLIVILVMPFIVGLVSTVTSHRTKLARLRLEAETLQANLGASRQSDERIAAMEDRLRVLERIITENRSSLALAHEIDALHDHAGTAPTRAAKANASS
jgi:uncharacterized coiled-coil DUF342 family protein